MIIHLHRITLVTTLLLLNINLSVSDEALAPPKMSDHGKSAKKSVPIPTPPINKDKPNDKPREQQEQFPTPDIVIRYKEGAKIEEYRVNGRLRYSKITPTSGPAYYLVDTDGDGTFDQRHEFMDNPPIQQWLLYTW